MPNYCNNTIKIKGSIEIINKLIEAIKDQKFLGTLHPEPEYKEASDWYDWRVANWGTKWEINDIDDEDNLGFHKNKDGTAQIYFFFNSAWAPPIGAYGNALDTWKDLHIEAYFYEAGNDFAGRFQDGELFEICLSNHDNDFFTEEEIGVRLDEEFDI
jgi:hypothetical protein